MIQTDKYTCRQLAGALAAFGVKDVVTSPGSRNAPLLMALDRTKELIVHSVVDERSAAFIAVGIAEISQRPLAVVCTSGSAVLNYGPAVAEAFYKKIPLIVVSADRPMEWIDQADSQTIRQPGALSNIVKASYSLKAEADSDQERWYVDRILNDAIQRAVISPAGPVHINISIAEPHTREIDVDPSCSFRIIEYNCPTAQLEISKARTLAQRLHCANVLIAGACNPPSNALSRSLGALSAQPNIVVVAEGISNIKTEKAFSTPDVIFGPGCKFPDPDILITFGGAPVSARMKKWLRTHDIGEHWHIGPEHNIVDTYMRLSAAFQYPAESFFPRIAGAMEHLQRIAPSVSTFAETWQSAAGEKLSHLQSDIERIQKSGKWSAPVAIAWIVKHIPSAWNLQLGNGMALRYAQLLPLTSVHRVDSNRGVSGIDGCTSTAVGASHVYKSAPTLLITGDMSFLYDVGALSLNLITPRLKIIVLNNGGGGIFRHIASTSGLPEAQRLLKCDLNVPVESLARTFGFDYLRVESYEELRPAFMALQTNSSRPVILEVVSDTDTDAEVFKKLLE